MKPMNCPGHGSVWECDLRSYRDLPIRYADFEYVTAMAWCPLRFDLEYAAFSKMMPTFIAARIKLKRKLSMLEIYEGRIRHLGMTYVELSTRPKKALGEIGSVPKRCFAVAMNEFIFKGN
jgi:threonyl-tRNA synthetase